MIFYHCWCKSKKFWGVCCVNYACFLIFWAIYVKFNLFQAITKRSNILFFYLSRYSKFIGVIQFFEALIEPFLCVCWLFVHLGHPRNIQPFSGQLRNEVKFYFLIRHNILRSMVKPKNFVAFFVLFMCASWFFSHLWAFT